MPFPPPSSDQHPSKTGLSPPTSACPPVLPLHPLFLSVRWLFSLSEQFFRILLSRGREGGIERLDFGLR